jgi:hypothetical protein
MTSFLPKKGGEKLGGKKVLMRVLVDPASCKPRPKVVAAPPVASLARAQRNLVHCVVILMSACNCSFVDILVSHFEDFWGMFGGNFRQHLFPILHGSLSSNLRDALHESSADAVACLLVSRA